MFNKMRREEKMMTKEEAEKNLKEADYGILALLQDNGYPYGVPLNFAYADGVIYFHGAKEGTKNRSIDANSKTSFTIVNYYNILGNKFDTEYDSVIAFGKCSEIFDEEKLEGLKEMLKKYSNEFMESGMKYIKASGDKTSVFKLEIEHITGKIGR